MRSLLRCAAILLVAVSPARSDQLVNDRSFDTPGDAQYSPEVALVHTASAEHLVCVWEQQNMAGTIRDFRVAVSGNPHGAYAWVMHGAPPVPPGSQWSGDVKIEAPGLDQDVDGTFLLVGQVRLNGGPPYTLGMASVRGHVVDENTLNWETPQLLQTFGTNPNPSRFVNALSLSADGDEPSVHLGYAQLNSSLAQLYTAVWFRRSTDFGATWSAPIFSPNDSSLISSTPAFQYLSSGGVAMFTYLDAGDNLSQLFSRLSNDGVNFGEPSIPGVMQQSFMTSPFGTRLWAAQPGTASAMISGQDNLFIAEGREMFHGNFVFPDPGTSSSVIEAEPNSPWPNATPVFSPGAVIRGVTGGTAPADSDWYAFPLAAGQTVMLRSDSVHAPFVSVELRWYGPDGRSLLSRWFNQMEFTAPAAAVYHLQVVRNSASTGGYRIRTMTGPPGIGDPRDQRDAFLYTQSVFGWSTPLNVSAQVIPAGSDEDGITLSVNRDGFLYAGFTDWSAVPGGATSRNGFARSADGGQTWQGPVFVNGGNSDWNLALAPTVGSLLTNRWSDVATDGTSQHCVWVDSRNGDADIYSRTFDRVMQILDVSPASYSASPGEVVELEVTVRNLDDLWGWSPLQLDISPDRNWPSSPSLEDLDAGDAQTFDYAFTVPDTAEAGEMFVYVTLKSGVSGVLYGAVPTTLNVLSNVGVEAGPAKLDFLPITPNPASRFAQLGFSLSRRGPARLEIFDVSGRSVTLLESGELGPGPHARLWKGTDASGARVASGAYLVRFEAEGRTFVRRIAWIR